MSDLRYCILLLQTANISMFSCLGHEALAIRGSFVNRLSVRSEVQVCIMYKSLIYYSM